MRKLIFSLVLLVLAGGAVAAADDLEAKFEEANLLYERRDFSGAIDIYESILAGGVESAQLYYNLGNASFKAGDVGHAVLNYLRAQRLDPGDEDIRHNLEFARQFSRVKMEGVELNPVESYFESLVAPFRLTLLAWVSSILFVLFCIALAARYGLGFQGPLVRTGIILSLVLVLAAAGVTTYKYRTDYLTPRVVIIAEECPIQNQPTENAEIEFQGAPGLVAEVLSQRGEYYSVLFENKRRGWVHRDLVAKV